jgi:hypothetical protein
MVGLAPERTAARGRSRDTTPFERLEDRVLLAGDHPSYIDFPSGTDVTINGVTGVGTAAGTIGTAGDDDLFMFQAPASDFVTILADALNAGSSLNSRLRLYDEFGALITQSSGNGTLTGGTPTDAWLGFVAEAGRTYYVGVSSDVNTGAAATGNYTLRIDAISTLLASGNDQTVTATLALRQQDIVYRVNTGSGAMYDSLGVVNANDPAGMGMGLDTRVEIYNSAGALITQDSLTGRLNDAFAAFRSAPDETFYIRIRSDEYAAAGPAATGMFSAWIDLVAFDVAIDPVSRQARVDLTTSFTGQLHLLRFDPAASGTAVIAGFNTNPAPPAVDPQLRLYNFNGLQIDFNNDFNGGNALVQEPITSDQSYFIIADTFSQPLGTLAVTIESNATLGDTSQPPINQVDDHANEGDWLNATPLIWGDPTSTVYVDDAGGTGTIADRDPSVIAEGRGLIFRTGDTDVFSFVPQVDMLLDFEGKDDGGDPALWVANWRPSSRLDVRLQSGTNALTVPGYLNLSFAVFDSKFNQIYSNGDRDTNPLTPPDPAGAWDPTTQPGPLGGTRSPFQLDPAIIWGGETYYIVVSSTGVGRYTLTVQADAQVDTGNISGQVEVQDGTAFSMAQSLTIDGNGNSANALSVNPAQGPWNFRRAYVQKSFIDPDNPDEQELVDIVEAGQWGNIHTIGDTDLYSFVAPWTGTVQIRINTSDILDQYVSSIVTTTKDLTLMNPDQIEVGGADMTKLYDSLLDSYLRVFDNDFEQIAYNDTNTTISGENELRPYSTFAGNSDGGRFTFHRRDAYVTFQVRAGEAYFVQVGSGQQYVDGSIADPTMRTMNAPEDIDWRHATGSYQLLIAASTNPDVGGNSQDDYFPGASVFATTLPIGPNGTGSINGRINNASDADGFRFIAPAGGSVTVSVARSDGSALSPVIQILQTDDEGTTTLLGGIAAPSNGIATFTFNAIHSFTYTIDVTGNSGQSGNYIASVSGFDLNDDHADILRWGSATPLEILDFIGQAEEDGEIEEVGDTDIFRFSAPTTTDFTINVFSKDASFTPAIEVYELQRDFVNRVHLSRIQQFVAADGELVATLTFGATADRIGSITNSAGATTNNYDLSRYIIVVRGADVEANRGRYTLSLDFPPSDDHPDAGQFDFATNVVVNAGTGVGTESGEIEQVGDTDLFRFFAPAGGPLSVTVTGAAGALLPRITLFDSTGTQIGSSVQGSSVVILSGETVVRNALYYVLVEANDTAVTPRDVGTYTLSIDAPAVDDHANEGEFNLATVIPLDFDGFGEVGTPVPGSAANSALDPGDDTDLFRFTTVGAGDVDLSLSPLFSEIGQFRGIITVFDGDQNQILMQTGASIGADVSLTIPGAAANTTFYVLISAVSGLTGEYYFSVQGAEDPNGPPPDPAEVDFDDPIEILLDARTGRGEKSDAISVAGDRDLFRFVAPAAGQGFVQIVTPSGQLLDVSVAILDDASESAILVFDQQGIPGANANVDFMADAANQVFYVLVDGVGLGTGQYTVRVAMQPTTNVYYFPEGFANNIIREFISVSNGNDYAVTFTVKLRYANGDRDATIATKTVQPGTRGGVTVSNAEVGRPDGVRINTAYSVIVESTGPIAATFAHYDFGATLGDALTDEVSPTWSFARVERTPGTSADFIVYYNPNDFDVVVTLTAYTAQGDPVEIQQTVGAQRRLGFNINNNPSLPTGVFSALLSSRAADSANDAAFIGIVASLSHYNIAEGYGTAYLGDPTGGSVLSAIPSITLSDSITPELVIFNPNATTTSVTIRGSYVTNGLPDFFRTIEIAGHRTLRLVGSQLGLIKNQTAGLTVTSDDPVTVASQQLQFGEADATRAFTEAGTRYFFGDGFMNTIRAGERYFETLSFLNPTDIDAEVSVRFLFTDGSSVTESVFVAAGRVAQLLVHETDSILSRPGVLQYFSIEATADSPFIATFTHYDLFLGGGWTASGAPLGLQNPLDSLT